MVWLRLTKHFYALPNQPLFVEEKKLDKTTVKGVGAGAHVVL